MVGDNKILTVSYGTFSCTLEGFDDPFSTMKNIAEYFRDLAAGDRFFGAEPPQPDPEMLQSIAEHTIQARVNAQLSDSGLVLRQDANSGSSPSVVPPMAAVAAAAVAPQVAPATSSGIETVAEKLQRIRAVVSRETAQDALFSEDQHVDEFAAETTAPQTAFDTSTYVEEVTAPIVEPIIEPQADEVFENTEDEAPVDDTVQDVQVEVEAEAETVTEQYDDEAELSADIDLSSFVAAPSDEDVATHDEAEAVSDDVDEVADTVEADTVEDVDLDAMSPEDAAETAVDSVLGRVSEDDEAEDATPRRRIVVQKITREDLKAAREDALKAAELKDKADEVEADAEPVQVASSELPPEQEEDLLRELAALQIASDDTAAEMSFETDENAEIEASDTDADDDLADLLAASKSDDTRAEDDLTNALSDLVSEDEDGYKKEELTAAREVRLARREAITEEDEDDVERLISTTSSRLDNDESSKRRASIAHLKAAVAATKADASLTEAAQEQEARERDQYAEDLARVVRPERKTATGERGKTNRPAPLVLVSALRIDKEDEDDVSSDETATDDTPVRPRRISRTDMDEQEAEEDRNVFAGDPDQSSFAEYAASTNALELPDLLEAAAAYYTYVESTEQFTRPMLMRKIASISARDGFSREAGLRSFGTLLREGKLVKGTDGKFVIAKTSRFTPEARYAGE